MRFSKPVLTLALVTLLLLWIQLATRAAGPTLHLHRDLLNASPSSSRTQTLLARASDSLVLLQLRGPVTPADRAALERTGVTLLEYIPDFAYLVRGAPAQIALAANLPQVAGQAPFTLADKLSPALLRQMARGTNDPGRVTVSGWRGDRGELARDVAGAGFDLNTPLDAEAVIRLARLDAVRWIEHAGQPRLLNDVARSIMNVNPVWQSRGLFGAGQIVAVTDSGLDTGDFSTL
ncbi:MAG TPA: hypothetical protein VIX58_10545, partial [Anaerolineae bacterium]